MALPAAYADLPLWPFGDNPELQERLAALIVAGLKTATCSAEVENVSAQPGERGLVVIRDDHPVAVIEVETATSVRFCDVTAEQAALEGEGDLSLDYWRSAHRDYFSRVTDFADDLELIFETFRLVDILDQDFASRAPEHVARERQMQTV